MNDRQLRYALAVRDEESFSRAATRLRISQPSVSNQVGLLEDEIGFKLFRRTGHGVELTPSGRAFLGEAEQTVAQLTGLADHARQIRRGGGASFALGMSSGVSQFLVPAVIAGLRPHLAQIELSIITAVAPRVHNQVLHHDLDAGLVVEISPSQFSAGVEREVLTSVEMAAFLPAGHRLSRGNTAVALESLAEESLISNEPSVGYGALVQSMFRDRGLSPNVVAVANSVTTIISMVRSGVGLAVLPGAAAEAEIRLGEIERVPLTPKREVSVVLLRPARRVRPAAETCLAALSEAVRGLHRLRAGPE